MTTHALLLAAAYHGERVASRRLAARDSLTEEEALRRVLELAAGADGLSALLLARAAVKNAAAAKLAERDAAKATALKLKMQRHQGPPSPWTAWFDGSAHPNPGRCGIGGVITGPAGERIEISRPAGYGNSSEAEYMALLAVLEEALAAGAQELTVYGDSQGIIEDAGTAAGGGAQSLIELRTAAQALIKRIGKVNLRWIPRHKNPHADALSQRAIASLAAISEPAAPPPHPRG